MIGGKIWAIFVQKNKSIVPFLFFHTRIWSQNISGLLATYSKFSCRLPPAVEKNIFSHSTFWRGLWLNFSISCERGESYITHVVLVVDTAISKWLAEIGKWFQARGIACCYHIHCNSELLPHSIDFNMIHILILGRKNYPPVYKENLRLSQLIK